ncbi:carboxy terminal-processing peptidase [Ferruginibacter lapsinanis]|uniref:carboxy terminal-processing peptidase n=1 Tax=Ferruginibacter lapsinanis TaxID=563172 RepID=UPI001E62A81D|nr:carboxy terminal-processing peptidase [Ferruginibacter lapsinanis]UEG50040.1 carboxy terminal-processing peptidase [Ferruginibacter lapsinanis]
MKIFFIIFLSLVTKVSFSQSVRADVLRQKVVTLRRFLEQNHYQPITWNDSSSMMLYDRWINELDDDKLLFSKSATNQLAGFRTKLDDELLGNGWGFFDKSIQLYRTGLLKADSAIKLLTDKPFDYTKPDNIVWPYTDYTDNVSQGWQSYLKWQTLQAIVDLVSSDSTRYKMMSAAKAPADFAALEIKARAKVKNRELLWVKKNLAEIDSSMSDVENNYLNAVTYCYDPHTAYMDMSDKNDFETEMSALEFSVGFEIEKDDKGDWVVSYLVPGGAAWKNGELHKGDVLIKIKPEGKPEVTLDELSEYQVSSALTAGSKGKITVTVKTPEGTQKSISLSPQKVTNEEEIVKSYVIKGAKKIGYINLPGFYVKEGEEENANGCSNDVAKEVVKLKRDSIAGLILDLRYNGGGSLGEALELAGIFIDEGTLTSTKNKAGKVHFLKDPNRGTIYDGPMIVLVNTMSASASELVSAALQDYHRALIVGSPTYGKGSAQQILPMDTTGVFSKNLTYDSYVKVTDQKFYRVDGSTVQWKGVIPDIILPDYYAIDRLREKANVSALKPDNAKQAIYQPMPAIPVSALQEKSKARVDANVGFKLVNKFTEWYKNKNASKTIPLQWQGYMNYTRNIKDLYDEIDAIKDSKEDATIEVDNNVMDKERNRVITEESKAINDDNLEDLSKNEYVKEAYRIMLDWVK